MTESEKPTHAKSEPPKPFTWRDILIWAGLAILGVYTLRELTDAGKPAKHNRRPFRYSQQHWSVREEETVERRNRND